MMARWFTFLIVVFSAPASQAIDVQVTIKRVDVDNARLAFGAPDGRERTARVAPDAKILDADGKELVGGLKSEQIKAGVRAMLTVVPEGNQPIIRTLRLGGAVIAARPAVADS